MTEQIVLAIIGASLGSGGITSIILALLNRKWSKKDAMQKQIEALTEAQKVVMIDRVRHLGRTYIGQGQIVFEDKENLKDMHKAYQGLGGNGHLDPVMSEVEKLQVVVEREV